MKENRLFLLTTFCMVALALFCMTIGYSLTDDTPNISIDGVAFSLSNGFYKDEVELEIYAPKDCEIYYTLDGTVERRIVVGTNDSL